MGVLALSTLIILTVVLPERRHTVTAPGPAADAPVLQRRERAAAPRPVSDAGHAVVTPSCREAPERPSCGQPELMALAAELLQRDPERTLELVRVADQRFGERHELRRVLEIEALVRSGQIGLSHAKASRFYRAFPQSAYGRDVERLTGYHPRPPGHE